MAVSKHKRKRKWKTDRLHWPGGGHNHKPDEAERLTPLEETPAFEDSAQKDGTRADDTIRVDSKSVQMPESFVDDEREGASIFRLEPVAVAILVGMLAFIALVAWQVTLMPEK